MLEFEREMGDDVGGVGERRERKRRGGVVLLT
jgi:hypothetical protein